MFYVERITTPANTTEAAPLETVLDLDPGIIHQLEISFPPGPAGHLHIAILIGLSQIWPSNPEGDFAWDNINIATREWVPVETPPVRLTLVTWNDDDLYDHDCEVRVGVLPRSVLQPDRGEAGLLAQLVGALTGRRR
jgi:hypothetical protein